jgi:hypothetical protein
LCAIFSGEDNVRVAIGVDVGGSDLQADSGFTTVGYMAIKLLGRLIPYIVTNNRGFHAARVSSTMSIDSLTSYEFFTAIAIQIGKVQGVGLREGVVDQYLFKLWLAFVINAFAFPKIDTKVVGFGPNNIVDSILIDITNIDRAAKVSVPVFMILPRFRQGIAFWFFVPTGGN